MMLKTRNYRKPSKQPASHMNELSGGPVSPSQAAERWPIRSEEHHRWGAHESLLTSTARVNASSTSIFRNQGDAILALASVGIMCAQLLLSVRRPFGSQSPARALCVRRSFTLGDLQAAFHRDCRDSALKPPPKNVNGLPVGPRSSLSSTD